MRCLEPRRQAPAMLTLPPVPPFLLFAPPSIHQHPRGDNRLLTDSSAHHPPRSTAPLPATRLPSPAWDPPAKVSRVLASLTSLASFSVAAFVAAGALSA
ncbi:hypothetical protein SCP_1004910 [Sparassis crispa]|uniref:Uncharacterized protein n=1 Tax=Sparassis crispa TaxID=139825 RepID=A0A401GYK7_9APHY|nr:hypothetical protein SCP_1004910 [Sparassis crispa]GBE87244.1 hypothetical protein SCP_1004910 [Sparassis crispa]